MTSESSANRIKEDSLLEESRKSNNTMSQAPEHLWGGDSIEQVIHDPISSGFLCSFCESQFCAESIRFVREIDKFRDYFSLDLPAFSPKPWRQIDLEQGISFTHGVGAELKSADEMERDFINSLNSGLLIPAETWPSEKVDRFAVIQFVKNIWDTFMAKNSPNWICIPARALHNTILRIGLIHLYGRQALSEAMMDPIKTLYRDIYPRFLHSSQHSELVQRSAMINEPITEASLVLPFPTHSIASKYSMDDLESGNTKFSLKDLIEDRVLYGEFLKYLTMIVSKENLLCMRSINIFKQKFASDDAKVRAEAIEQAWITYRYFVAVNSPFEVSMSHIKRKELMRELAKPNINTFDKVEKSAMGVLKNHFSQYTMTKEYAGLGHIMMKNYQETDEAGDKPPSKWRASLGISSLLKIN